MRRELTNKPPGRPRGMIPTSHPAVLPDGAWKVLRDRLTDLLPAYRRKTDLRAVVEAILYRVRTGCQWRLLPLPDGLSWGTVWYYFDQWSRTGVIDELNLLIVSLSRRSEPKPDGSARSAVPTAPVVDAQSVKSGVRGHRDARGFDGNKRINGIKRHVVTDTGGRVVACLTEPANAHEGSLLRDLLIMLRSWGYAEGAAIFADAGYRGQEAAAAREGYRLEVVSRADEAEAKRLGNKGFRPVTKRWVIEQTFGALAHNRAVRVSYDRRSHNVEGGFLWANIARLVKRLGS